MEIVVKNGGPVYRFHGTNLVHFEREGGYSVRGRVRDTRHQDSFLRESVRGSFIS